MNNESLTIIIPTYNRESILRKCLVALSNQSYPKNDYGVIVIDDGSLDGTESMMKTYLDKFPCSLKYFKQKNKGPAAARNIGIMNAAGNILLFLGDDIIAEPHLIEEHMNWHQMHPEDNIAVLGYITWSPEIKKTPFMHWLENGGPQFLYWKLKNTKDADTRNYFYSSNISLKKTFLLDTHNYFDEDFPYAACEDIELGARLKQHGLKLKYNENAVGYHHHYTSFEDCCRRMVHVGESRRIMDRKSKRYMSAWKSVSCIIKLLVLLPLKTICAPLCLHYEKRQIKPLLFTCATRYFMHLGYLKKLLS